MRGPNKRRVPGRKRGYGTQGKYVKSAIGGVASTPPKRPLFHSFGERRVRVGNEGDFDVKNYKIVGDSERSRDALGQSGGG